MGNNKSYSHDQLMNGRVLLAKAFTCVKCPRGHFVGLTKKRVYFNHVDKMENFMRLDGRQYNGHCPICNEFVLIPYTIYNIHSFTFVTAGGRTKNLEGIVDE